MAALSAKDIWAVGYEAAGTSSKGGNSGGGSFVTLIEHWNGTSWKVVSSPSPTTTFNILDAVTAVPGSTSQTWAVGDYTDSTGTTQSLTEEHL